MRKLAAALVLAALPSLAWAAENRTAFFNVRYDLDATTLTACVANGISGPWSSPISGNNRVKNAGSETAVTAVTATEYPFLNMAAGDTLWIKDGPTTYARTILTYTDADNIVVDEALDLSADAAGYAFRYKNHVCGTGASAGWISLDQMSSVTVMLSFGQMVSDGDYIHLRLEGSPDSADGYDDINQLWPTDKVISDTATLQIFDGTGITDNLWIEIPAAVHKIRVLVEFVVADDGNDLTTNSENLTFQVFGQYEGS